MMYKIIHHCDADGWGSAAVLTKYLMEHRHVSFDSIQIHYTNYGKKFPGIEVFKHDTVYVLDFSPQPNTNEEILKLKKSCNRLVWIDHHSSYLKDLSPEANDIEGIRNINHSACRLTYEWLYGPDADIPTCVQLIDLYDTWQNTDDELWNKVVLPFNAYLNTYINGFNDFNEPFWSKILTIKEPVDTLITDGLDGWFWKHKPNFNIIRTPISLGKIVLDSKRTTCEKMISTNMIEKEIVLDNKAYNCLMVNTPVFGNSNTFDSVDISIKERADLLVVFALHKDGAWRIGLYAANPDSSIHCGNICKQFGGGGHKNAAGFTYRGDIMSLFGL